MPQLRPNPDLDHGLRLDLDGRARYLHAGFTVELHVRHATADDHLPGGAEPDDVVMTGTVSLCSVELAAVSRDANLVDGYYLVQETVNGILAEAVTGARRKVAELNSRLASIDLANSKAATTP